MKSTLILFSILIFNAFSAIAQHHYYKNLSHEQLQGFSNDSSRVIINEKDSLFAYKAYFDYVLRFYPKTEFKKIIVQSGKTNKMAKVRTKGLAIIAAPEERVYKITISKTGPSLLDTVAFKNLETNSKIAFIAREIAVVDIYSKSGFFEMIGLFFKQRSLKNKGFHKEINLNAVEAGLGFQLMAYTSEVNSKLEEEYWRNKKAYKKRGKRYLNTLLAIDAIKTYLYDYPVYMQNNYK
jgi:hypothetical protein